MSDMKEVDIGAGIGDGDEQSCDENSADVAQLVKARQEALKQKQLARRSAWQEQVKTELDKRAEYKLKMEGATRKQITDWKDKVTLSKISEKWRKTFKKERTQFLFNEMFPIISQRKVTRCNITFDDMFECRQVSKGWKETIDNCLSSRSGHYNQLFSGMDRRTGLQYEDSSLMFNSFEKLKRFNQISQLEYHGLANPFPFRQLYIGYPPTQLEGYGKLGLPYWIEMEKLLERWGKEIWTVFYAFDDGSIEMMYEFLIKYLSLMPNLRELAISERDRSDNVITDMLRSLGKDVLGPLKSRMERKPLPELPKLRSINIGTHSPAPLIEAALEKYGDTLESFKIEGSGFDNYPNPVVLDIGEFVARRDLPFTKYSSIYIECSRILDFQFPALNELSLEYDLAKEGPRPELANIFKTVNSCGATVRRLQLKIIFNWTVSKPGNGADWRNFLPPGIKLELPHLEWLDLTVEKSKISDVDFILPLVSLKEMTFSYHTHTMSPETYGGELIQFVGYRDRLYDSNIWNLLPEIKLVTINTIAINKRSNHRLQLGEPGVVAVKFLDMKTTVHTRDGYRHHQGDSDKNRIQRLTEQMTAFTAK